MEITRGKQSKPVRAVVYGPEGIGKSTFAAQWPDPLFIDVEKGTGQLDVARTPSPTSWTMLKAIVEELSKNAQGFKTLVIDTADWADKLASNHVCASKNVTGIEDIGYGKGWTALAEEWKRFLDLLTDFQAKTGMHILFLAHAAMRKFEQPDEAGSYDRYELKMEKKSSSLLKEWADMLLFANYKTIVTEIDGKKKAQGGTRIIYTAHHPCWDAKNRFGFKTELPFEFKSIASAITECKPTSAPVQASPAPGPATQPTPLPTTQQRSSAPAPKPATVQAPPPNTTKQSEGLPLELANLMEMHGVTEAEIQAAVAKNGHFPIQTPIKNYGAEYIKGRLVPNWNGVMRCIEIIRKEQTAK